MAKRLKRKSPAYNPLAPSYKNRAGFNRAVGVQARSQIQPQLNELQRQARDQASRHTGRDADISRWHNFELGARQGSYDRVNTALNGLITTNAGLSGASQAALAAALRSSGAVEGAGAESMGISNLVNPEAAIRSAQSGSDLGTLGVLGGLEADRASSARDIGLAGVGGREANDTENRRYQSIVDQLDNSRGDLMGQLPGLQQQARQQLSSDEVNKQGQRFQQRLAGQQFSLSEDQFGESKRANRAQEGLARSQFGEQKAQNQRQFTIDAANVENTRQSLQNSVNKASDDATRADAQAKADRFDAGIKILNSFLQPTKQETGKHKLRKGFTQRVTNGYESMVRQLMGETGMGPIEARQVILSAMPSGTNWGDRWLRRATQEVRDIKRKRQRVAVVGPGSVQTPGPGGGYRPG